MARAVPSSVANKIHLNLPEEPDLPVLAKLVDAARRAESAAIEIRRDAANAALTEIAGVEKPRCRQARARNLSQVTAPVVEGILLSPEEHVEDASHMVLYGLFKKNLGCACRVLGDDPQNWTFIENFDDMTLLRRKAPGEED